MKSNQWYDRVEEVYSGAWHCTNTESNLVAWVHFVKAGVAGKWNQRGWALNDICLYPNLKQDQTPLQSQEKLSWPLLLFLMTMEAVPQGLRPTSYRNTLGLPHPSCFLTRIFSVKTSRHSCMGSREVQGPINALWDNPWLTGNKLWWINASLFLPSGGQFWDVFHKPSQ